MVLYPLIKTKINFELKITLCNPKALIESFPTEVLWYTVGDPKTEFKMPTFS
jgi:hypothetical protein